MDFVWRSGRATERDMQHCPLWMSRGSFQATGMGGIGAFGRVCLLSAAHPEEAHLATWPQLFVGRLPLPMVDSPPGHICDVHFRRSKALAASIRRENWKDASALSSLGCLGAQTLVQARRNEPRGHWSVPSWDRTVGASGGGDSLVLLNLHIKANWYPQVFSFVIQLSSLWVSRKSAIIPEGSRTMCICPHGALLPLLLCGLP